MMIINGSAERRDHCCPQRRGAQIEEARAHVQHFQLASERQVRCRRGTETELTSSVGIASYTEARRPKGAGRGRRRGEGTSRRALEVVSEGCRMPERSAKTSRKQEELPTIAVARRRRRSRVGSSSRSSILLTSRSRRSPGIFRTLLLERIEAGGPSTRARVELALKVVLVVVLRPASGVHLVEAIARGRALVLVAITVREEALDALLGLLGPNAARPAAGSVGRRGEELLVGERVVSSSVAAVADGSRARGSPLDLVGVNGLIPGRESTEAMVARGAATVLGTTRGRLGSATVPCALLRRRGRDRSSIGVVVPSRVREALFARKRVSEGVCLYTDLDSPS